MSAEKDVWDLIVVGAGSAGLPAAIFAADRGARVLLLESQAELGGTLWVSMGQMSAAGAKLQAAKGIADSTEAHFDDVMALSRGGANPALVRLAVEEASATVDWLCDHGLEVDPAHPVQSSAHEPYSQLRYYWGPAGGQSIKAVFMAQLEQRIARGQVTPLVKHAVVELTARDGAVTGVVTQDADGVRRTFEGRNVMLSTGGYGANPKVFERLSGAPQYLSGAYPGAQGDGLTLAASHGATLVGAEKFFIGFGAVLESDVFPARSAARLSTFPDRRPPWEIYVNVRGERFVREDVPSVHARQSALMEQPDHRYWVIFDQAILEAAPPMVDGWTHQRMAAAFDGTQPSFITAPDLATLADRAGIDADGLARTVADYNRGVGEGRDALGRGHLPSPIAAGPFYAIRQQGGTITSAVGLAVDDRLRVVRDDGTVIPNLYAAGEILGSSQTMGRAASAGMMLTPALTFGRLLGQRLIPLGDV